jgi:hypothetical protein
MSHDDKPYNQEQALDPEHEQRFKDLVRGALTTPVTDALKEEEREHQHSIVDTCHKTNRKGQSKK